MPLKLSTKFHPKLNFLCIWWVCRPCGTMTPTRGLMVYMLLLISCARGFESVSVWPECLNVHQDMTPWIVSPTIEKVESGLATYLRPRMMDLRLGFQSCLIPTSEESRWLKAVASRGSGEGTAGRTGDSKPLRWVLENKVGCIWSRISYGNVWDWCLFCGVKIPQVIILRVSWDLM